jgi:hypothetical protein
MQGEPGDPGEWPFADGSAEGLVSAWRNILTHRGSIWLALWREQLLATCSPVWANPSFEHELGAYLLQ